MGVVVGIMVENNINLLSIMTVLVEILLAIQEFLFTKTRLCYIIEAHKLDVRSFIMDEPIIKAEIESAFNFNNLMTKICVIIYEIAVLIFIVSGFKTRHSSQLGGEIIWYDWWIKYQYSNSFTEEPGKFFPQSVLFILALFILLASLPFIIKFVVKKLGERIESNYSLDLYEDKVVGSYGKFSKKELTLPIDQLSGISVKKGLLDRLTTGETLVLATSSGFIRFPLVMNSDEFSRAAINAINAYEQNFIKSTMVHIKEKSTKSDISDLRELKSLLDDGIITEEEFNTKKKEILGL